MENQSGTHIVGIMTRFLPVFLSFLLGFQAQAESEKPDYENSLLQTIQNIQQLRHDQALNDTRELISHYPTSKVGQLLYADLLLAKAGVLSGIGSGIQSEPRLNDLTFEIKQRLSSTQTPAYQGYLPGNIITLADNQPYILVMDQSGSRLYVYRNEQGTPILEADYFLSIGLKGSGKQKSGDQKTPIGIYHVTRYIDDNELPDLYGKGAFPINYPNVWDKRRNRSGGGIWLHGTPSYTYNRAPWSSDGCMVVSNQDFADVEKYINPDLHTPIIIVRKIKWITLEQWQSQRLRMHQILSRWISDWESNQHDRYIRHYSASDFKAYGRDFKQWEGYKRWVNRNKKNIRVEYNNLSIYNYPGEQGLVLMQFDQSFSSNILNIEGAKELYWKKQQDDWKIVYEGIREFISADDRLVEN